MITGDIFELPGIFDTVYRKPIQRGAPVAQTDQHFTIIGQARVWAPPECPEDFQGPAMAVIQHDITCESEQVARDWFKTRYDVEPLSVTERE